MRGRRHRSPEINEYEKFTRTRTHCTKPLPTAIDDTSSTSGDEQLFAPAIQFLSVAALTAADQAAGGNEPIKIGLQRENGHRAALQYHLGIVKEFIEIAAPKDSLRKRPVLRRMLSYLGSHPDIRYVIYTGSREPYTRTPPHAVSLYRHFKRLGVGVLLTPPGSQPGTLQLCEGA